MEERPGGGDVITSVSNARVKRAAALKRRKGRRAAGRYLVEGPHPVAEAIADGVVTELFATSEAAARYADAGVDVVEVADHVLVRLADGVTPQGVVAVAGIRVTPVEAVVGRGLLAVVHAAADPGNVGTLIRTADAAGATAVVLTNGSSDPYGPKAVRAAAGSTTHLPLVVGADLDDVLDETRAAGQVTVALDAGADDDLFTILAGLDRRPRALVLGSESHGLTADVQGRVDHVAAIPIFGRAESLNVAAAGAIALYAAARR